jgi:hypothetical protein
MGELTLNIGYKLIKNIIGEEYAEIVHDVASNNVRNKLYFPMYAGRSCGELRRALPKEVLQKLSQHFGGQTLYIRKENLKIDDSKLKQWAADVLSKAGASPREIAQLLSVTEKTVLNGYAEQKQKATADSHQRQLTLF